MNGTAAHPPAYQYERPSPGRSINDENRLQVPYSLSHADESLGYSSNVDSDSYIPLGGASSLTGLVPSYHPTFQDATDTVREMHLALLYLLSNPEEFQRALQAHPANGATTLAEWNAEYENESMTEGGSMVSAAAESFASVGATPLPFVVFADDAEVVLPQAHTASQLFGMERVEGIELEAAAGIHSLSQLFLRWLALMPGGDHLNMIDPPGLTVMRIAGGRYRVTAAHRVVWTWMNNFAPLAECHDAVENLQVGDLVSMTIVDVFETDNQGRLLSYCPTFDNRAVHKTSPASETIRKSSSKLISLLGKLQNSKAAKGIMNRAKSVAVTVKHRMGEAAANYNNSPHRREGGGSDVSTQVTNSHVFEEALNKAEQNVVGQPSSPPAANMDRSTPTTEASGEHSHSDSISTREDETNNTITTYGATSRESEALAQHNQQQEIADSYVSDTDDEHTNVEGEI